MTLIMGFYSKKSIVLTADGRCIEDKKSGEKIITADNNQKIFPVQDLPIAIVHHGERRINNCEIKDIIGGFVSDNFDYVKRHSLREIAEKFKLRIDLHVKARLKELEWLNTSVGLWVAGFNPNSDQPEIYEVFWKHPSDASVKKFDGYLNRGGDGRKFIECYFKKPFSIMRYSLGRIKSANVDYLAGYHLELYKLAENEQKKSGETIFGGHIHQLAIKDSGWKWKIPPSQ